MANFVGSDRSVILKFSLCLKYHSILPFYWLDENNSSGQSTLKYIFQTTWRILLWFAWYLYKDLHGHIGRTRYLYVRDLYLDRHEEALIWIIWIFSNRWLNDQCVIAYDPWNLQILVVESTTLISSFKIDLHPVTVFCEFLFPTICSFVWFVVESTRVENFWTEFNQSIESLQWMTWRNFLFGSESKNRKAD